MIYSINNKDELEDFDEIEDPQSKVNQVRFVEKLGEHWFQYNVKELFEPNTKKSDR